MANSAPCGLIEDNLIRAVNFMDNIYKAGGVKFETFTRLISKLSNGWTENKTILQQQTQALSQGLKDLMPDFSDANTILNILYICGIIDTQINLLSLANLLLIMVDAILFAILAYILTLMAAVDTCLEILIAIMLFIYSKLMSIIMIPKIWLKSFDKLLNCLDAICGINSQLYVDKIERILQGLGLGISGGVDVEAICAEAGVPSAMMPGIRRIMALLENSWKWADVFVYSDRLLPTNALNKLKEKLKNNKIVQWVADDSSTITTKVTRSIKAGPMVTSPWQTTKEAFPLSALTTEWKPEEVSKIGNLNPFPEDE